jgi:hypothetical protein
MTRDPEILFKAVAARDWQLALSCTHGLKTLDDTVSCQARQVLTDAVMHELGESSATIADADLEKVLMLHRAGSLRLAESQLDAIADELVDRNQERPHRAARFARLRPGTPSCRAVLEQFDVPKRISGPLTEDGRQTRTEALRPIQGGRSIFRSAQERLFFKAAAREFPGRLLVPNAALHSALDYDSIRGFLSESDRALFFRVLVDLVVFEPEDDFRPSMFFELDSPWHDDPFRAERDRRKERFLTLAGYSMTRIRTTGTLDLPRMQTLLADARP